MSIVHRNVTHRLGRGRETRHGDVTDPASNGRGGTSAVSTNVCGGPCDRMAPLAAFFSSEGARHSLAVGLGSDDLAAPVLPTNRDGQGARLQTYRESRHGVGRRGTRAVRLDSAQSREFGNHQTGGVGRAEAQHG